MTKLRLILCAGAAGLALAACGQKTETAPPAATADAAAPKDAGDAIASASETQAPDYDAIAAAAVADPARPEADRANDANRKPAATLAFMMIAPGENVFEMEAGGGYYTEMVSRAVGPNGSVVMQNPPPILKFVGDAIKARLADDRLANVRESISNFDHLDAEDGTEDVVTWVWGPHELYFHPSADVNLGDVDATYAEIFRILKPGGVFVAIDHRAENGAPQTTGNDLHRIDPAIVKAAAEKAGFVLDAEGDFLKNPDDPHNIAVFDKSIRGHTDQFALRFRKPA
ncbi:MAG: hypothetical protein GC153_06635 [Alphaproteobacteria bacterium]|nr:hypothetical protein [Alphaproteobacteria bacterium]